MNPFIDFHDLLWQSDWLGYEVGYPDSSVIGLYRWRDTEIYLYVDVETMEILEIWEYCDIYEINEI